MGAVRAMKTVLVVSAHADDEVLGCGATMVRHTAEGDQVYTCFMTGGVGARRGGGNVEAELRREAAKRAGAILGVKEQYSFEFPDNQMDSVPLLEVTKAIEGVIQEVQPDVVYTHFQHDLNIDHQRTHQAVMTACRPQAGHPVKEIFAFEVLSSTEWQSVGAPAFQPNVIVSINQYFDKKVAALQCYEEEMREFPHSRSYKTVEALAIYRGATYGVDKAEAFRLERLLR